MILFDAIQKHKLSFWLSLSLSMITNVGFAVVNPIGFKLMIDHGILKHNYTLFLEVGFAIVLIGTLLRVLVLWGSLLDQRLKNDLNENLTGGLFKRYYAVPYSEVMKNDGAYYVSRIYDEPVKASNLALDVIQQILSPLITGLASLVIVLTLSWKITMTLAAVVPILFLLSKKFGSGVLEISKTESEEEAVLKEIMNREISAYRAVTLFGLID